jgi:hypothetical protein
LLPKGDINEFPRWPPDAFAVAATLAHLSGFYSRSRYTGAGNDGYVFSDDIRQHLKAVGGQWRRLWQVRKINGVTPAAARRFLTRLWRRLVNANREVTTWDQDQTNQEWWDAAIQLLIAADEASAGVGFSPSGPDQHTVARFTFEELANYDQGRPFSLPHLPWSVCWQVPATEVTVLPKSRTAQLGCTLRSLTHHLALLPPVGEVRSSWTVNPGQQGPGSVLQQLELEHRPFNVLLVPFPFHIDGKCFVAGPPIFDRDGRPIDDTRSKWRFLELDQRWLRKDDGQPVTARDMGNFLKELIEVASAEAEHVDGIVLPELALSLDMMADLDEILATETGLELFISGYLLPGERAGNYVHGTLFIRPPSGEVFVYNWEQSKHHRWMVEGYQIERYQLGDRLHPECLWWEDVDIRNRKCHFVVFRRIGSLVTLVCEDLARIDPVQSVIRAVGPTLVIALLMDGAQLEKRWSGRYATVLADDPGSAVLTLTSLGLMRRSLVNAGEKPNREIALWKGADQKTRELQLASNHHALLLTLSVNRKTHFTLDGRSDEGSTIGLLLSKTRDVKHPSPPTWARAD